MPIDAPCAEFDRFQSLAQSAAAGDRTAQSELIEMLTAGVRILVSRRSVATSDIEQAVADVLTAASVELRAGTVQSGDAVLTRIRALVCRHTSRPQERPPPLNLTDR